MKLLVACLMGVTGCARAPMPSFAESGCPEAGTPACSGTASLGGSPELTFNPTFVGATPVSGSCECSGPSYHGIAVLISDDTALLSQCNTPAPSFDFQSSHYLAIQVTASDPPDAGLYSLSEPGVVVSASPGDLPSASLSESLPTTAYLEEEVDPHGAVQLTSVTPTIAGRFDAFGFLENGSGLPAPDREIFGTFSVTPCSGPVMFSAPCPPCPL